MATLTLSKALMSADGATKLSKTVGEGEDARETLELNLDALTGADMEICIRDAGVARAGVVPFPAYDVDVRIQVAAKASGLTAADIRRLGARDYLAVSGAVSNFLNGSD